MAGNAQCVQSARPAGSEGAVATTTDGADLKRQAAPAPGWADLGKRKRAKTQRIRESGATTTSGKAVTVRLSQEELEALARLQTRMGAGSRSDALRSVLRASVGLLEFPPEQAAKLGEIKSELHKIGVNVNQIALAANRGRVDLARAEWQALNELRLALPKLRTWLNAVVEEQRRRGVRLFRNYSERADG
ncbi:plasmid mobilization relaxosome protein MobC [Paracoccus litorisediminis]|uniref:Plasmid mobilization relaxosome protein MobC n=1 Tax=Paracoccus litorisediminis TaxID=2006130 RepID=A0A844HSF0_9RHOB|nr:plasmid mobilization relaxosome protein MobC [Paracoccus litorisediminis]